VGSAFETALLASGDSHAFCTAVAPQLDAYADAVVTWITIEPASRSLTEFRSDIDMLATTLVHR
jgi:hypothetical protein